MGVGEVVSDEPGLASPSPSLFEDIMSVWTILQLNRFTGKHEATTLFGSSDRPVAWQEATEQIGVDFILIAIWKGDFAKEVVTEKP
jgi:hypothetical protein